MNQSHRSRRMMPKGFSRLELMVVLIVFGAIAAILLDRLHYYQEAAEKADMEYGIRMIRGGLRVQMSTMLIRGHAHEFGTLAGQNPMDWMEQRPPNYLGSIKNAAPARLPAGNWYFDQDKRELVYLIKTGAHFQAKADEVKRVQVRVVLLRGAAEQTDSQEQHAPSDSVLVEVDPYRWF